MQLKFEGWTSNYVMNAVFRDVTPCGSCENQCFGGT
jgi:hypothetical protein